MRSKHICPVYYFIHISNCVPLLIAFPVFLCYTIRMNSFEKIYQSEEIYFRYAKGNHLSKGQKEIHPFHEIVFLLEGEVDFVSESRKEKLEKYTLIVLPKKSFHQFIVHGEENDYARCIFHFDGVRGLKELIDGKVTTPFLCRDERITNLFLSHKDLANAPLTQTEKDVLLHAFLSMVLLFAQKPNTQPQASVPFHPITANAIAYINNNMHAELNVQSLANALRVSESYLSHVFKADMQVPVYKYVLDKKLAWAHGKIQNGVSASEAAIECGFNDYSGFFRQYKKTFGFSPSKTPRETPNA